MKLTLNESYKGEFDENVDKIADKLERGIDSLRHVCGISKSDTPDGAVAAIDEVYLSMKTAYESRLTELKNFIETELNGRA